MVLNIKNIAAIFLAASVSACGGGGSDSNGTNNATPSNASEIFPLQKAMTNLYTTGYEKSVSVSGTATADGTSIPFTGNIQISETPTNLNTTFDNQPAIQDTLAITGAVTADGYAINLNTTLQSYVNANYQVLGSTSSSSFCVAQTPTAFPSSVAVGQSGLVSTTICYTDSTHANVQGSETISYVISAGTTSGTANATLTTTISGPTNQTILSIQGNYLIDTIGNYVYGSTVYTGNIDGVNVNFTMK